MRAVRLEMGAWTTADPRIEVDIETYDQDANPAWATVGHWSWDVGQAVEIGEALTLADVLMSALVASIGMAVELPFP